MHELSICRAIAATATDHARGRHVESVRLKVGHFKQVIPETLVYCWELHTRGGPLDGAALEVDYIPAVARCKDCAAHTELAMPVVKCGECESTSAELISGEEFLIESIQVSDQPSPSSGPPT